MMSLYNFGNWKGSGGAICGDSAEEFRTDSEKKQLKVKDYGEQH